MEEKKEIIQTHEITKRFNGTTAVEDLSFSVEEGTIFGFIGPSGSGKTTTIRMLTGYYRPTEGELSVFGSSPAEFSRSERERIGYLPQLFGLYPNLTVWENLNFAASLYGLPLFRKRRLFEELDFVELRDARGKLARDLSAGMQRRLNLAATLLHKPDLIFLDEPTAGVDPVLRRKFWDHFRHLKADGRTLFITTQYVSEAIYCDLVALIDRGRLVIINTPAMLRREAYGGDLVDLQTTEPLDHQTSQDIQNLPFVYAEIERPDIYSSRLVVQEANTDIASLLDWAREKGLSIKSIEEYLPPFDDVFVELVNTEDEGV